MLEHLSPTSRNVGLYDGIARALFEGTKSWPKDCTQATFSQLIDALVQVLRNDNAAFNEARFRRIAAYGRIDVPRGTVATR